MQVPISSDATSGEPISILLVGDARVGGRPVQDAFAEAKVRNELRVAADIAEVLALARGNGVTSPRRPDVVFIDMEAVGSERWQTLLLMKQHAVLSEIPAIALTRADEPMKELARRLGADAVVTHPLDTRQITEAVRSVPGLGLAIVSAAAPHDQAEGRRTEGAVEEEGGGAPGRAHEIRRTGPGHPPHPE